MRRLAAPLLLALALGLAPSGVARAEPIACGAPPEALEAAPLPGAFAAIARGQFRVLVVGSASTASGGTSSPDHTWPQRLKALLAVRLTPVVVELETYGARGSTAADHARILATEARRFRPHLVVWQLGTVEAARGMSAEEMSEIVQDAATRLRAARGELTDLMVMDMQFSRFFRANANVEPYRDQLRYAAAASGAHYFSRWTVMKHWAETDRIDLERAPREQRTAVADQLHDCLARALTAYILEGTQRNRR
ncbi:SGNH/GDSL hydrolase family protein [Falsiroseomonas oryzae]|uniref:SGNH/GDSL hydrolase family protein n=1 Tax=Falsiroseomonas oryzae TaxID=2766473 RepID=UPI0022EA734F|nr:SGNH/GDSL hydrolase family protein [Roseomonas sp. MO-31]